MKYTEIHSLLYHNGIYSLLESTQYLSQTVQILSQFDWFFLTEFFENINGDFFIG